jgi:hypothetical protein
VAIRLDFSSLKAITQGETFNNLANNPALGLYWQADWERVALYLCGDKGTDFTEAALLDKKIRSFVANPACPDIFQALGRVSGVSIEQLVLRHLPEGAFVDVQVALIPGALKPLMRTDKLLVLNGLDLDMVNKKLHFHGVHLLSFLANRVHRMISEEMSPRGTAQDVALAEFFLDGAATLFFSLPGQTEAGAAWLRAEEEREHQFGLLKELLTSRDGGTIKIRLAALALEGPGTLAAKYPLATYICQVIEGAFGRARLVELLATPAKILQVYEEARQKFSLPERYSVG